MGVYSIASWDYIGIIEKKMETTMVYWDYIGIMEKEMETTMVYWGYIGIMENKMETMVYWGYIGTSGEPLTTSRRPLFLVAFLLDEFRAYEA